jgi:hypothetical protein
MKGATKSYRLVADSGNEVTSAFCPGCGSPLYKTSSGHSERMFFHAATLETPDAYVPKTAVWTKSRQPWDRLDPALLVHGDQREHSPAADV